MSLNEPDTEHSKHDQTDNDSAFEDPEDNFNKTGLYWDALTQLGGYFPSAQAFAEELDAFEEEISKREAKTGRPCPTEEIQQAWKQRTQAMQHVTLMLQSLHLDGGDCLSDGDDEDSDGGAHADAVPRSEDEDSLPDLVQVAGPKSKPKKEPKPNRSARPPKRPPPKGQTTLFNPHTDAQIHGPDAEAEAKRLLNDHTGQSTPYCRKCHLIYVTGPCGHAASSHHPSHRASDPAQGTPSRSIVVRICGFYPRNGKPSTNKKPSTSSVGIWFGPNSKFNVAEVIHSSDPSEARAALEAARKTLTTLREKVLPHREELAKNVSAKDKALRVIAVTESSYVVNNMTKNIAKWRFNKKKGVYISKTAGEVKNSKQFVDLVDEVNA
jgi:hypothetical protein